MLKTLLTQDSVKAIGCLLFFSALICSCSKALDTADPKKSFVKIYNDTSFRNAITPIDVVETAKGYLILATNEIPDQQFPSVTLLAIDAEGKVVKQTTLDATYVSPAKGIFKSDTNYRFLAMNGLTTQAYMMEVDSKGNLATTTPLPVTYPLCVGLANDGNYLIQGYSQSDRATMLAKVSTSFATSFSKKYDVLESADEYVFGHLSNTGKKFPFSVGQTSTSDYYFNGFRNFTFALVFVNSTDQNQKGVINGFRYSGGINSITPLEGNKFAISRFYFGNNYINPNATLATAGTSASTDITGRQMLELEPDAVINASRFTIKGKKVLLFASNTVNKQIVIYVYDELSGSLIGSKYLGLSIPCTNGALTLTRDGGLLVTGSAYINGRFKRIAAFKLAASQLDDMVK